MTGRNHTTNGMASITEASSGFPSSNGHIPFECGTVAEVLGERGWNTYMVGEILTTERPQLSKPRSRYVYYLGGSEIPESVAPNIRNRSYTVAVEATIDTEKAGGVLFSQGSRFGGHALYIKDRKLKYVYNFVGLQEQIVESTEQVPTGHVVLSASSSATETRCRPRGR